MERDIRWGWIVWVRGMQIKIFVKLTKLAKKKLSVSVLNGKIPISVKPFYPTYKISNKFAGYYYPMDIHPR